MGETQASRKEDDSMAKKTDLTQGSIMPQITRLCIPLLAANILQQLYNIINSLVVTHYLGQNAFAALGVAESIVNLFTYVITGACMGASVLTAQLYGEGNMPRLRRQLFVSAVLIGGCVLAAVAAGQLSLHAIPRRSAEYHSQHQIGHCGSRQQNTEIHIRVENSCCGRDAACRHAQHQNSSRHGTGNAKQHQYQPQELLLPAESDQRHQNTCRQFRRSLCQKGKPRQKNCRCIRAAKDCCCQIAASSQSNSRQPGRRQKQHVNRRFSN